jgi:tetratricopeptide (TPR) repeat protein
MRLALLVTALTALACAPAARSGPQTPKPADSNGAAPAGPVVLPRTVITPGDAADVDELYARAEAELGKGRPAEAARGFDRVHQLDPNGPRAAEALYQGALAQEQAGDREASLRRFEQLASRFPAHALSRDGLLRAIRLLCFLERWKRCGEASDLFVARYPSRNYVEDIVTLGAKALFRVSEGDADSATYYVEKARTLVEEHRLDAPGKIPRDVAQVFFALGEARRLRAEKIRFNPLPVNFAVVLEARCQLLLDAQSAYSDTMRAYDAHWSAMAGFRVGELYHRLHADLMDVPQPKADTVAKKQLFEGAMRLRYSILLDKALAMMEHTLSMAGRAGERSSWVEKAQDSKAKLDRARKAEQAAIDRLPYTREQLKAALDDLAKKAESEANAGKK